MPAYYSFLTLLTRLIEPRLVVELGTDKGYSALAFETGGAQHILTYDLDPTRRDPRILLPDHPRIEWRIDDSLTPTTPLQSVDLLFIDTDDPVTHQHSGDRALREFETWFPYLALRSYVLFDDIYINPSMSSMWHHLTTAYPFTFTLDLHAPYGMGLLLLPDDDVPLPLPAPALPTV